MAGARLTGWEVRPNVRPSPQDIRRFDIRKGLVFLGIAIVMIVLIVAQTYVMG
jgi:hypothetical protein